MTVRFSVITEIAAPTEAVFMLSTSIEAHLDSMAASREQAVGGVTEGQIELDEFVTWRAWHFGVPFTMTSLVTELEENVRFVDEQIKGPFSKFRHEHVFEAIDSGTRMTDHIEFDAPLGVIGDVVERILLGYYMRRLIAQRNSHLKENAEASVG